VLAPISPHWPATLAAVCRSSILVGRELAGSGRQPKFTRSKGEASVANRGQAVGAGRRTAPLTLLQG
jgi:hypothetical protein